MRLLLSIILISSVSSYAQQGLVLDALDQNVLNADLLQTRYKEISGSPYYFVEFTEGTVEFINNKIDKNVSVRIDIYASAVQLKLNNNITEFDSKYVRSLSIHNPKTSEVINFTNVEINGLKKFVVSYFDDKIKLFGVLSVEKRISTSSQTGYSSSDQQDKFVKSETYFVYLDGKYNEVKINKKSILGVLGEDKSTIAFIKTNKLKLNRMDDVVRLFEFYNNEN